MSLKNYKNLVPDSPLHRHLESLLHKNKGKVSAQRVCEKVLMVSGLNGDSAETLVGTFLENDPRFLLNSNGTVEWAPASLEDIWKKAKRFAVFDLETSSEGQQTPRIMEAGFCFVEDGKITEEWSSLINPERSIPPYVRRLTGISNKDVRQAPRWPDVLPKVLEMLEDTILVAHQARFDYDCLNYEISRQTGYRLTNRYMCTVEMSRTLLPGSDNYRLETLSQWLNLTHDNPHRAGSDARATAELLCHMLANVKADWTEYLRPLPPYIRSQQQAAAEASAPTEPEGQP